MNWRNALVISAVAVLGLALLPTGAVSQQKSLKDQLVGTWAVVSLGRTASDGTKRQIPNPKGILIFDAGGRYAQVAGRGDVPNSNPPVSPRQKNLLPQRRTSSPPTLARGQSTRRTRPSPSVLTAL